MTNNIINLTAQAKAIRKICTGYVDHIANERYTELMEEIKVNPVMSQLIHLIGTALIKEEAQLEKDIERQLLGQESNVYFDSYRYCMTCSREMIITVSRLMGW